ncbi:MAG: hypothetical protein JNK89_00650, partial [Saprospiraceae bacterium]|nr:hypothetical protein [Saprospiraceae bacterium]
MKSLLYTALLSLAAMGAAFAQNNPQPFNDQFFYAKTGNPDWLTVREGVELSAAILSRQNLADLGLSANDELRLYRTDVDDLGFTHYRYHQYFRGVRVDGAELLLHEKDGRVRTLNGKLVRGLQADVRTTLNADQALQRALQHRPAQRYMWQAPGAEALLRRIKNDPAATFFPKPELVLVAPGFTQQAADFQAAWRVEVFADQPAFRHELFVSAFDGALLESVEMLCEQNTPGTAHTKYSGERQIFTDSIAPDQYRLVETTRGNGIETYDMKRGTDHGAAVDFLDADN